LLVEDDPTNRKVAIRFLGKLGYKIDFVCNGEEALAAMATKHSEFGEGGIKGVGGGSDPRYDVILMDVHMPRMNGLDATTNVRSAIV
jgi:CheY-like chemotaxis protein